MKTLKEACGVFGIYNHPESANLTYLGLYALQHRGQESAGIVSSDGKRIYERRKMGLVADVFRNDEILQKLKGHLAIGHNRYSTTGSSQASNIQPLLAKTHGKLLAIGHNGNLVNSKNIRARLESEGALFQTTTDTEVILHIIARSDKEDILDCIIDAMSWLQGAFTLVFMTKDMVIATRDSLGFRPLCLGKIDDAYVVASESCAFDLIGAEYIREVEPGEVIALNKDGVKSFPPIEKKEHKHCIFENIYFSRPDSIIFGENVDQARRKLGEALAKEYPVDADIVISVPDSSNTAALGYAHESGIKFELGLIRNHYVGRTFINPGQSSRSFKVKVKYNTVESVLKGKRVVVVEDSIVRGTTLKNLTKMMREAGAKEIHVRVSCPPIRHPCYYGIDFPTKEELIANGRSVEDIAEKLEVDSLEYLSLEGMLKSMPIKSSNFCTACFNGKYPTKFEKSFDKLQYEISEASIEIE